MVSLLLPSILQPPLNSLYSYLYHSSWYRFSAFETLETIVCYVIVEGLFTYRFACNPHLRIDIRAPGPNGRVKDENGNAFTTRTPKGPEIRQPAERLGEILTYAAPLLLMDFTMIKKFAGVPICDIRASGNYHHHGHQHRDGALPPHLVTPQNSTIAQLGNLPINSSCSSSGHHSHEISPSFLLPTLHNFTLTSPLQLTRALPPPALHPPTPRGLTLQLVLSLLIYDGLFFLLHLALHRLPALAKLHQPHHTHPEIHPQVTNRLSVTERLSLVLLANFSLNVIGSHVLTRTVFIPVFVYLLVELHSGLDLAWGYEKILPRGWGAGAKGHAAHHRAGKGGLAPFFRWWDHALSVWDRWWDGKKGKLG